MRNSHNPFDCDNVDKNYIEHDNIYIMGTINYTDRYRLFNAISDMVHTKISMAQKLRTNGNYYAQSLIRINLACPDTKEYINQTERFFRILQHARTNELIIETNVVEPLCLNSWAAHIVRTFATPGFKNMFESAYCYYYPKTYDPNTGRTVLSNQPIIVPPDDLLKSGLCNTIFLNNGRIKTL